MPAIWATSPRRAGRRWASCASNSRRRASSTTHEPAVASSTATSIHSAAATGVVAGQVAAGEEAAELRDPAARQPDARLVGGRERRKDVGGHLAVAQPTGHLGLEAEPGEVAERWIRSRRSPGSLGELTANEVEIAQQRGDRDAIARLGARSDAAALDGLLRAPTVTSQSARARQRGIRDGPGPHEARAAHRQLGLGEEVLGTVELAAGDGGRRDGRRQQRVLPPDLFVPQRGGQLAGSVRHQVGVAEELVDQRQADRGIGLRPSAAAIGLGPLRSLEGIARARQVESGPVGHAFGKRDRAGESRSGVLGQGDRRLCGGLGGPIEVVIGRADLGEERQHLRPGGAVGIRVGGEVRPQEATSGRRRGRRRRSSRGFAPAG